MILDLDIADLAARLPHAAHEGEVEDRLDAARDVPGQ